jgi:hypothetical protein
MVLVSIMLTLSPSFVAKSSLANFEARDDHACLSQGSPPETIRIFEEYRIGEEEG